MSSFSTALANAYRAQQEGQLDAAESQYREILSSDPGNGDAHHLLGVLETQRGRHDAAIESIQRAIEIQEGNPAYHYSLGRAQALAEQLGPAEASLRRSIEIHEPLAPAHLELGVVLDRQGRGDEALACFDRALRIKPDYAMAYFNAANVLRRRDMRDAAIESYNKAIELDPGHTEARYNLALCLREASRGPASVEQFRHVVQARPDWAHARGNLAVTLMDIGEGKESLEVIESAVNDAPDDHRLRNNYGNLLIAVGRYDEALEQFRKSVEIAPDYGIAYNGLGSALRSVRNLDEAIRSFERAVELAPDSAPLRFSLADAYDRVHRTDDARPHLQRALELNPGHAMALLLKARIERHDGHLDEAKTILQGLMETVDDSYRSVVATQMGHTLEDLGEYDAAFEAFSDAQRTIRESDEFKQFPQDMYPSTVAACRERITEDLVATWEEEPPADGVTSPIFFVGFPRSGTTLMEQVFDAHPALRTTGERPVLNRLITEVKELTGGYRGYPEDLDDLTDDDVAELRRLYFEQSEALLGSADRGLRIVDKQPLNIVHLGVVRRVFPEAPVVVALRDPRAVCWSCFIQEFQLNQAMIHFSDLGTTADLYAGVMDLWLHYRSTLGINYFEYRYEDLVENMEATARKVLEFAGVPWDDSVLKYHEKAKESVVTTPSFRDVTKPVYSRAVDRWRHYESHLQAVTERVAPFLREFGYED